MGIKLGSYGKDIAIVLLVSLMSLGANLPDEWSSVIGINKNYLLVGLVIVVIVSMVRYLKFTLILVIAILSIGANLPVEIAEELGVDAQVMFLALVAMVATSFLNFVMKLPKGAKPIAQINSVRGARTLCQAAGKGHASMVYSLISTGINPNFKDEQGNLPVVVAAGNGQALIVKLLLDNGANPLLADGRNVTALQAATTGGFSQTAMLLKNAALRAQQQQGGKIQAQTA